jgi:hypothetical protein
MTKLRQTILGIIVPALAAGAVMSGATGQSSPAPDGSGTQSVYVRPVGTSETDPNGGQWFVASASPGENKLFQVRVTNINDFPQTVRLYLADIAFDKQGVPEVSNTSMDVGTWGRFENETVTLGPRETTIQSFSITVPEGIDPGDHVGAVVAEHEPEGSGNVRSVKRVAVRLYVTLPGDARRDFVIDQVAVQKNRSIMTSELDITVALRNTGRVRLEPSVHVDGKPTEGATMLMSQAVERYTITRAVGFFGGPVRLRVEAQSRSLGQAGPARDLRVTVWVIPWHLFIIILVLAAVAFLVRRYLRNRKGKYSDIQADIRRIERLVSQQMRQTGGTNGARDHADAGAAIRGAIKQARRAHDGATVERLELALQAVGGADSGPRQGAPQEPHRAPPAPPAPYAEAPPDVVPPSPWTS